jgi:hypothetical protein
MHVNECEWSSFSACKKHIQQSFRLFALSLSHLRLKVNIIGEILLGEVEVKLRPDGGIKSIALCVTKSKGGGGGGEGKVRLKEKGKNEQGVLFSTPYPRAVAVVITPQKTNVAKHKASPPQTRAGPALYALPGCKLESIRQHYVPSFAVGSTSTAAGTVSICAFVRIDCTRRRCL